MNRVKVVFECDRDVLIEFKKLVLVKYGTTYGILPYEFTEALRARITQLKSEVEGGSHG